MTRARARGRSKAAVVGAGITGCVAALCLQRQGMDVEVYDTAQSLGGVLRDIEHEGERYFSSCQYLNRRSTWLAELEPEDALGLREFDHTYASYTRLSGEPFACEDFAGPVVRQPLPGALADGPIASLGERIARYPEPFGSALLAWLNGFTADPAGLHESCARGLQVSRAYFQFDDARLMALKQRDARSDELLGVPRSIIDPAAPRPRSLLPLDGYNALFGRIGAILRRSGIEVRLGMPVAPKFTSGGELTLSSRNRRIDADLVVWCGNPVPLLANAGIGRLDNPVCRMIAHGCDVEDDRRVPEPYYVQVFAADSPVTRIFVYRLGGKCKATVESFDTPEATPDAIAGEAKRALAALGYDLRLRVRRSQKQRRYFLYTTRDWDAFESFELRARAARIVSGAWWLYGRDAKVEWVTRRLADMPTPRATMATDGASQMENKLDA